MTAVTALRTTDRGFADLPDFPFPPHYVDDLPNYEGLLPANWISGPTTRTGPSSACTTSSPGAGRRRGRRCR